MGQHRLRVASVIAIVSCSHYWYHRITERKDRRSDSEPELDPAPVADAERAGKLVR